MNSSRYCFDTEAVPDFTALCGKFASNAFQSPYRSTVPLLSLAEHSRQDWNALLESWGAPTDATVHVEYCVPSANSGGNPSQTDALLISDSAVWAVEAKWTEPRYQTVAKRLTQQPRYKTMAERLSRREADLAEAKVTVNGWLEHLNRLAARALQLEDVSDVVYQVLHRAASACAIATENDCVPHLIYLHFHPSPLKNSATTGQYISDLGQLHALLGGPTNVKFTVVEMPIQATSAFESIKDLDKSSPATSAQVTKALRQGALFTFGTPTTTRIGDSAEL